ncbi:MAG: nuclear transport factor 2 family protein [Bacteroidetes bacterium]|nr:nuclear transport factor 2 family protein [Bacteroidota bacterium]
MLPEQNKKIAQKWFEAFNAQNLEELLSLYDENAEHYSPKLKIHKPQTQGLIKGKQALREWWHDAFNRLPTLNYEVIKLTADDEQVFMEYIRHVKTDEDLRVAEVLQVKNGLIVFSRVYHG